jgi:YegS/Rv2252/BmrU family lipid kinase
MGRRALVIANRHSRRGRDRLGAVLERLRAGGIELDLAEPRGGRRGIGRLIRERAAGSDLVVLGGGDGTMNAAAEALLETGLPLAILPLGTGNDLARTLGVPLDPLAAAEVAAGGTTRRIDLGRVNDKHFFNVASIGLSVRVAEALTGEVKRRLGTFGYPVTVYRVLKEGRAFRAEIRPDGAGDGAAPLALETIQLAVGNGRFYGGGLVVDERAEIDDRLLHLYALRPRPLWRLAARALAFRRGRHDDPGAVEALAGRSFEVVTDRPMRVNTDGEITTCTPARFSVVPAAIEVLVPAPTPPGDEA